MKITMSFPAMLGLLFIALKLTGKIAWSWWWVLSPFTISFSLIGIALIFFVSTAILMRNKEDSDE